MLLKSIVIHISRIVFLTTIFREHLPDTRIHIYTDCHIVCENCVGAEYKTQCILISLDLYNKYTHENNLEMRVLDIYVHIHCFYAALLYDYQDKYIYMPSVRIS